MPRLQKFLAMVAAICAMVGCALATVSTALAEDITCLMTLIVDQKGHLPDPLPEASAAADSTWTVTYTDHKPVLDQVTIFDGPPKDLASLVPDEEKTVKGKLIQTWTLAKNARGYWLQCDYSDTSAAAYRKLPDTIKRCRVSYDQSEHLPGGHLAIESVSCDSGK
jgi:hypothetical protein